MRVLHVQSNFIDHGVSLAKLCRTISREKERERRVNSTGEQYRGRREELVAQRICLNERLLQESNDHGDHRAAADRGRGVHQRARRYARPLFGH